MGDDESRAVYYVFYGARQPYHIGIPADSTALGRGIMRSSMPERNDAHIRVEIDTTSRSC